MRKLIIGFLLSATLLTFVCLAPPCLAQGNAPAKVNQTSTKNAPTAGHSQSNTTPPQKAEHAAKGKATSPTPEPTGFYVSPWWLALCIIAFAVWIKMMDWVNEDAEQVGVDRNLWNSLFLGSGIVGSLLIWFIHGLCSLILLVGLIGLFSSYIHIRNLRVAPNSRLFTREHLSRAIPEMLARIGIRIPMPTADANLKDNLQIILLKKDGTNLQSMATNRDPNFSAAVTSSRELIQNAVYSRATDIHLEPKGNELQVRYRIDGVLHSVAPYPSDLGTAIISSLKVLSDMDITERRKPQDGTFSGVLPGKNLDFRVNTMTSVHGETMVIRILDSASGVIKLDRLGMEPNIMNHVKRIINQPHGLLIVSGPTGAGKSTTLYAALSELDAYQKNIVTIENPVEYQLDNVTQTNVNPKAGVDFAGTLRSILRQDPDVIMVGEIRDAETARTAAQASQTGHLVLTTIHANDSITSVFRLLDLGVEAYLIASSLTAILAQRLVRTLCPECKVPYTPPPDLLKKLRLDHKKRTSDGAAVSPTFYKAQGCEACQGTGFKGRIGIFELLVISDNMRDMIRENPSIQAMKAEAEKSGLVTLLRDGLRKVEQGITSVKELIRVTK